MTSARSCSRAGEPSRRLPQAGARPRNLPDFGNSNNFWKQEQEKEAQQIVPQRQKKNFYFFLKKLLTSQGTCDIIDTERGENKSPEKERMNK